MEHDERELLRRQIDQIDGELIGLLRRRMDVAEQLGAYKREHGLPIYDAAREQQVIEGRVRLLAAGRRRYLANCARRAFSGITGLCRAAQELQRNIYIIGMSGSGKTTFGRALAQALYRPFLDTDVIAAQLGGASIPDIFAARGEAGFRLLEHEALQKAARQGGSVVATGGGILTDPSHAALMKAGGIVIYLTCTEEELLRQRIASRPMLRSKEDILPLYRSRQGAYEAAADLHFNRREVRAAAAAVTRRLENRRGRN